MTCLLLMLFLPQEYYFIDVVEFRLDNGVIIKTTAEVVESRLFYSWNEDGYNATLPKERIRSIRHSAIKKKGRKPYKKSKTATQRRISGRTVAWEVGGAVHVKCRHVDGRGRSTEGSHMAFNVVADIMEQGNSPDGRIMKVSFSKVLPGSSAAFRFYDLRGKLMCTGFLQIPPGKQKKKKKKNKKPEPLTMSLTIPEDIDLFQVGLVEVVSEKPDSKK